MLNLPDDRQHALGRLVVYLRRYGAPRVQLFLILVLTGTVGATLSFILLRMGLKWMWLRYPLAACLAYLTFLVLLRMWAHHQLNRPDLVSYLDHERRLPVEGTPAPSRAVEDTESRFDLGGLDLLDLLDVPSSLDEIPVVLLVIVIILVIVAILSVLVIAPVLLAEVLLDGLLVAGLWRRFKQKGATESVWGTLRATYVPAMVVIAGLAAIGYLLHLIDPSARSIGDVLRSLASS